jgi:ribosomal protein L29
MKQEKETLNHLGEQELKAKLDEYRRALFMLKLDAQSAHVKDYSQFSKLRKSCARVLTHMRQKELGTHGTASKQK